MALIGAGGTISNIRDHQGLAVDDRGAQRIESLRQQFSSDAFSGTLIDGGVVSTPSREMSAQTVVELASLVDAAIARGSDGVVIAHGTDLIEETAYGLALMLKPGAPVVLTASMRLADAPGFDGPANLVSAIRVAATPEIGALGPVVVLHDEIHLARWVSKSHSARLMSITSTYGPVGFITEGRVTILARPTHSDFIGRPTEVSQRVELLFAYLGADGYLVDAAARVARGIVIAGTGGGHVSPGMANSLRTAVDRGVSVVLTTRCQAGPVLHSTYGGLGSEQHLQEFGVVAAGDLSPYKARLRLLVAVALGIEPTSIFPA